MDFLNKLYESNYFGIGLFTVICFLVVTFLIVLFFGKKDEKKRKLEETMKLNSVSEAEDTFSETTPVAPVEVPVAPVEPVAPIEEVAPVIFEKPVEVPVNRFQSSSSIEEPAASINETPSISPIIEPVHVTPFEQVNRVSEPVAPVLETPTPVIDRAVTNEMNYNPEPKVLEPMHFNIPVEPVIKEEPKTIITPNYSEKAPIIEEPVVQSTYYRPVEKPVVEEVKVPDIDFDAIAKSISKELDELENANKNKPVEVSSRTNNSNINQFSSVYVSEPVKKVTNDVIDLPQKIDLPVRKGDE